LKTVAALPPQRGAVQRKIFEKLGVARALFLSRRFVSNTGEKLSNLFLPLL